MQILPGIRAEDRYRTVGERQIVNILLVAAFVSDLAAGLEERAVAHTSSALDRWVALGLDYRMSGQGERLFDPVEVVNFMKWSGRQGLDDFWVNHFVATSRQFFSEWNNAGSAEALHPDRNDPARFKVELRRTFDLSGIEAGQKLRLRLPLPLSQSSEQLEIEPK